MSKQESNVSTISETRNRVKIRLQELYEKQNIRPLRDLFITELNYDYSDMRLNLPDDKSMALVYANAYPRVIATGGDGDFKIIYIRLRAALSRVSERTLMNKLLPNNLYTLFVFSDAAQQHWHFVNVKESVGDARSRLFRRITIGPEEQLRTAIERITMLDLNTFATDISTLSALAIQDKFDEAFDVAAVTQTFFREYRTSFDILQKDLYRQTGDEVWAHDYALLLLNRCMFLYFIQRKRWLAGDTEFLKTFWEAYHNGEVAYDPDTFVRVWLNTLFFKAFNNKYGVTDNHFPLNIHNVLMLAPFLNGGLFTENDLDRYEGFVVSDESFFKNIFSLLQRYNFTIAEDSPLDQEVAVDPEMIGTVYESLVNVSTEIDERSDAGIFYTPRTEIDLMCRLTLVDYLANHLGNEQKHLLYNVVFAIEQEDKEIADQQLKDQKIWQSVYDKLISVKVIDPACGSGAFLVGMLYVLDDLMSRAIAALGLENSYLKDSKKSYNAYERKKRIIGRSLYGVDVMDWAVHIAELRLWLTLIVDTELNESFEYKFEPLLPYFTFNVRCGDSLVQEVGGIKLGLKQNYNLSDSLKKRVEWLKGQKFAFYNNYSRDLRRKEDVEREEKRLFVDILTNRIKEVEGEKQRLTAKVDNVAPKQLSLVDATVALSSAQLLERKKLLAECEEELVELRRALDALYASKVLPFVWDIAFGEIFADKQYFDIVIGNPPYLRQENIHTPSLKDRNKKDYSKEDNKAYKTKLAHTMYKIFPRFFGYTDKYGRQTITHPINAKSDLYIYFYFLGLSLLNNKGTFCFITSNSWLDVGYGADLQEFLLKHCHIKLILDNKDKRSFASASVNTVIAHFSPPNEKTTWGLQQIARFVMSFVPFESLLAPGIFERIESAQARQSHDDYRVFPILQRTLLEDGKASTADDGVEEEEKGRKKGKTAHLITTADLPYTGNKWGGKYLRAPDIYWTILEKGKGKLVRLGDIAEVRRGVTTGANEFFYLDETTVRQWQIEPEFLVPVIKSPRECKSILIDTRTLKSKLFLCHKSKAELKGTRALAYIEWGESRKFQERPSCAGRPRWWDLGERRLPPLSFNYLIDTTARTIYAPDGCYFSDNFQDIIITSSFVLPLCASLNSTVFQLMVNVAGRANFGDGLLKIQTYEVSDLLCLHPKEIHMDKDQLFASSSWNVLTPSSERIALDTIIFDALNLTQSEREAVYEEVNELINARLDKAKSLSTAKETRKRVETVRKLVGVWMGVPDVVEEEEELTENVDA